MMGMLVKILERLIWISPDAGKQHGLQVLSTAVGKYCEISWYRADVKLIFRVKLIHVLSPKQLKDGDAIH